MTRFRAAAISLVLAAMIAPTMPSGAAGATLEVASGDGLTLRVTSTGTADGLTVDGRNVFSQSAPLFSIRRAGGTPNLLSNSSFEADDNGDGVPDGWRLVAGAGKPQWVSDQARTGTRSLKVTAPTPTTTTTFQAVISVKPETLYRLDSWIRTENVQPSAPTASSPNALSPVRLKLQQLVGSTVVSTTQAFGYTDTASWHRKFVGFKTRPDVTSVRVLGQLVAQQERVWFDDLFLAELLRPTWIAGKGTVDDVGHDLVYDGAASNLNIDATLRSASDHIRVDGVASSPTNETAAFQLRLTLPVAATGWQWADDPRHARAIEPGRRYEYLTEWNAQQTSRYPFNTVFDDTTAMSIGVPIDRPALARSEYADGKLHLTFDLGVSPATSSLGGARAPFSMVLYKSDAAWGYRAAIDKYYRVFPHFFERRTDVSREGGWFNTRDVTAIGDAWDDFGLGLHMLGLATPTDWGAALVAWDNDRGVYATGYNHHWGFQTDNALTPAVPAYDQHIAEVRAAAVAPAETYAEQRTRDRSVAELNAGARDNNGRYLYEQYREFLQHYVSLNPLDATLDWREVSQTYQMDAALDAAAANDGQLDAVHLDSVSGMRRWGLADDYAKAHWANAPYGLTFSYDSGQVVDRIAFGVAAEVHYVSEFAHARGMILTSNFNASDARSAAWFGADAIDYFGLEQGLPDKVGGENDPYTTVDSYALFKRTLANQRPVSTLDPEIELRSAAEIEKRFHQTLLYGIYLGAGPGMDWREEHRVVFAKYTPLVRALNAAGWEVVTRARSSNPVVLVERFGSMATDDLYLVIHNPTPVAQTYAVTAEQTGPVTAMDRITGAPIATGAGQTTGDVVLEGQLAPFASAVVRVQPA